MVDFMCQPDWVDQLINIIFECVYEDVSGREFKADLADWVEVAFTWVSRHGPLNSGS